MSNHVILNPAERELGIKLEPTSSFREAFEQANLNFTVRKAPIFFQSEDGTYYPFSNRQATFREDTQAALGVVTPNYSIIQNHEAFSAFDALLTGNQITLTHARVFLGGARLCLLGKFQEPLRIFDDVVTPYLMFVNSHDGRTACIIYFSPVRMLCTNMLPMAAQRKDTPECVSIHHTGDTQKKLTDAAETLALAHNYFHQFVNRANALASRSVQAHLLVRYFQAVFNAPKDPNDWSQMLHNKLETVHDLFETSEFPGNTKDTWWAAYNAATEYVDWKVNSRIGNVSERSIRSAWLGSARLIKHRAFKFAIDFSEGNY